MLDPRPGSKSGARVQGDGDKSRSVNMGCHDENGVLGTGGDAEEKAEHLQKANHGFFPFSTTCKAPDRCDVKWQAGSCDSVGSGEHAP